ncbi:MAG: hypothetical protein ACR2O3_17585 [Rhizobiaceae bacterium]
MTEKILYLYCNQRGNQKTGLVGCHTYLGLSGALMTYLGLQRILPSVPIIQCIWHMNTIKKLPIGKKSTKTLSVITVYGLMQVLFLVKSSVNAIAQEAGIDSENPTAFESLAALGFGLAIMGAVFILVGQRRYRNKQKANKDDSENSNQ